MEPSLEEIQQRVLDTLHAGEPLDRAALLEQHPEHTSALQAFFSVVDVVEGQTDDGPPLARLGEFRILGPLGRGGMGVVYDAEQTSLKRRVALKVLPPLLRMDPRVLSRFRREAEAAGRLRHPNIVPVYSVGEAAGTPFFAMERVEGKSLQEILVARAAGEPIPVPSDDDGWRRWSLETVACIADALTYAHGEGILHRDVKPGNILIEADGTPRLTDFGLALDLHSPGLTQSGEVLGSPQYMSPEQALRRDAPVDERTDVYSLAVTLFEMLTRKLPYEGTTSAELFTALVAGRVIAPRRFDSTIPPALEKVLLCALRRDPRERYRNTAEFALDLRAALDGRTPSPRALAPARRRTRWRAAAAVAALALVAVGVWWATRESDEAPAPVADAPPAPSPEQAAAERRWRDAGLRVEDGQPVVTAAFYKHYVGRRLMVLKDTRPLAFWLDLEEIHLEDGPIRVKDLLGKVFADPAERDDVLAQREKGMDVARRFCRDWNENWSNESDKARYDRMVEILKKAGMPAVPYLFHVLSADPATAFGGRAERGEVTARMQVRALFALKFLGVDEGVPLLIVQCTSPSLTVASNAGVLLQQFTGEDFSADFLKAPVLADITWWSLRRKARVVGTRATVRAMLRQLQEGIADGLPGDASADWWNHTGMRIVKSIERVIGRKLPVGQTRDMGSQLKQLRKLQSWWDEHEVELIE